MKFAVNGRNADRGKRPDRAWVVAAARKAFGEMGPGATIAEIADCAGISVATVYRHFRNRDDLVHAVLDDLAASLHDDDSCDRGANSAVVRSARLSLRRALPPLAAMAALLPLGAAPTAAAAAPADEPAAPVTVLTISPLWPVVSLDKALGGSMCRTDKCTSVPYVPFVTPSGVKSLDSRLSEIAGADTEDGGPTIVFGFSQGAGVAEQWLATHSGAPGEPSPDELSFVLIGNPRRAYGGSKTPAPPSEYTVIDIVRQYDPMADFPDHPFNLLALANIAGGMLSPIHLDYTGVDVNDPANTVWTEGNTTYVFVPTENLPLLNPLRRLGLDKLADELNAPLKEIVERAYDRPYLTASPTEPVPETATVAAAAVAGTAVADDAPTEPRALKTRAAHRASTAKRSDKGSDETSQGSADETSDDAPDNNTPTSSENRQDAAADTSSETATRGSDGATASAAAQTRKAPHRRGLLNRSTH